MRSGSLLWDKDLLSPRAPTHAHKHASRALRLAAVSPPRWLALARVAGVLSFPCAPCVGFTPHSCARCCCSTGMRFAPLSPVPISSPSLLLLSPEVGVGE